MPKGYPLKTAKEKEQLRKRRNAYSKEWRKRNPGYHKEYSAFYNKEYRRLYCASSK